MNRIDHLLYATPDLDATVLALAERFGVRAAAGGAHPGRGTRNALLSLGERCYLEIIGPDPEQPAPAGGRRFGVEDLRAPRLVTWVACSDDVDHDLERARLAGEEMGVAEAGSRRRTDGIELRWRMAGAAAPRMGGILPFLIDWGETPHPAASSPDGCRLLSLRGEHPDAARAHAVIEEMGLELPLTNGPEPRLVATIETPRGVLELS